jgi:hypothetical protein
LGARRRETIGEGDVSSEGHDQVSLGQAVTDLKAMDKRLAALIAAYPPAGAGGPDFGTPIRESRALLRAAIGLLAGALLSGQAPNPQPGTGKRRVKIKAASESTASSGPAGVQTAVRSNPDAPTEPAKPAARGGDRARSVPAAASVSAADATATSTQTPPNSLLARLGAAAPEAGARPPTTADVAGDPAPPAEPQPSHVSAHTAAERLARLEAEIDTLTEATTTKGGHRSKPTTADVPAAPATRGPETEARAHAAAAATASATAYWPGVKDEDPADGDDDAEIVIVTPETKASASTRQGAPPARQSPRIFQDPAPSDDDDAEVEIVQPGARPGRAPRAPATTDSDRSKSGASEPVAPARWRLFRGSR